MIADMLSNEKLNPIVTELFIRGTKLNSSVFITQSHLAHKIHPPSRYENFKQTRASTNCI